MPRILIAVAAVLLLSGCVWSRLLDWKGQLKEFDRYVTAVDDGAELVLQFKQPCIRPGDIGFLFGSETPSASRERAGGGIYASWILRRDRADSKGLDLALGAADGAKETLADSLRVPSQVLAFIPKQRLLATARAFGSAEIDRSKREAAAGLSGADAEPISPGRAVVVAALGEPDSSERIGDVDRMTFTFKLVGPDGSLGKATDLILDLRGDLLVAARLKAPNFNAWMEFNKK
jgi:hypothetical protein